MDLAEWPRYLILTTSMVCVMELLGFIYTYWKVVIPLLKRREGILLVPPVRISFAYHLLVTLLLISIMWSQAVRLSRHDAIILPTYLIAVVTTALTVVVHYFLTHYIRILRKGLP